MAIFSRRLCFLTRALKNTGNWPIYSLGVEVSAFGNEGAVGKRHNRAGARWAPFCAAVDLGF
ncbi:hypothetical protein [uncultured Caulobacter sp.]|uniref:hypothetical protein n=1 Tax=uncultured Caulobacter sp. TaxID=158749 RepID=UPI002633A630|nr:hypothetical protein [uncultured Caulobacter sp.]